MAINSSGASRYRVLADYEVNDPHPLELAEGTPVQVVRKDAGWPGWVWIRSDNGAGWVPESCLLDPLKTETITVNDFDGTDLSAKAGDILTANEVVSGWVNATSADGKSGWFPLFNLRPTQ